LDKRKRHKRHDQHIAGPNIWRVRFYSYDLFINRKQISDANSYGSCWLQFDKGQRERSDYGIC